MTDEIIRFTVEVKQDFKFNAPVAFSVDLTTPIAQTEASINIIAVTQRNTLQLE